MARTLALNNSDIISQRSYIAHQLLFDLRMQSSALIIITTLGSDLEISVVFIYSLRVQFRTVF